MARLIDADWLKNKATPRDRNGFTEFITTVLFGLIDQAPTIDAEPVRHGKWVKTGQSFVNPNKSF